MNSVALIGRLTKDPETRAMNDGTAVCKFSIAIDNANGTDFPNIVCFGKTAENVARFMTKGRLVGISGRIKTGSYEKQDGTRVYTTDVVAYNVEFLDRAEQNQQQNQQNNFNQQQFQSNYQQAMNGQQTNGFGFEEIESDIPF